METKDLTNDIEEKKPEPKLSEQELIGSLFELTDEKSVPWKKDLDDVIVKCYLFKETDQWTDTEKEDLKQWGVPPIPIDRISRSLDTLDGIRDNTNSEVQVDPRETGDQRIAEILKRVTGYVKDNSRFDEVHDDSWDGLKDIGIGITRFGYDPQQGEGEVWFEEVPVEACGWSKIHRKDWSDIRWFWYRQTTNWEDAVKLAPEKAAEIKSSRQISEDAWNELNPSGGNVGDDYRSESAGGNNPLSFPDQVDIWEFWIKKIIPFKKIAFEVPQIMDDGSGGVFTIPQVQVRKESLEYQIQEGEQESGSGVDEVWMQHRVIGKDILITPIEGLPYKYSFLPYVPMIAELTKNGRPRGVVEKIIPFQKRINLAWAEKTAWNNKALKSPLTVQGEIDIEHATQQSQFGTVFVVPEGTKVLATNTTPNVNLQAIEEGNMARQDMDYAVSASEPVMRGQSDASSSGIKVAKLQDAAITPINKWIKADKRYLKNLWKKVLQIIIAEFDPARMARIVGEQEFNRLFIGKIDPITQQPLEPPLQIPFQANILEYDISVRDKSISDFKKQQSFNASLALHQGGFIMDGEYVILHAPIEDAEDALQSHYKARNDVIQQLVNEVNMLQEQLGQAQKMIPKESKQKANAVKGRNQPQSGQRSMIGGQKGT